MKDKSYYKIDEASEILNCTCDDVIYLGSQGSLPIYILTAQFKAFAVKIPLDSIDEEDEYVVPADDEHLVNADYLKLTPSCIKTYESGGKSVKVELSSESYDEDTMLYFNLHNSHNKVPMLRECVMVVLKNDLNRFWWLALQADKDACDNSITEKGQNITSSSDVEKKLTKYDKRLESFDKWIKENDINIESYGAKREIHNALKQIDKTLWQVSYQTFDGDFWQRCRKERGIKLESGRPSKIKN